MKLSLARFAVLGLLLTLRLAVNSALATKPESENKLEVTISVGYDPPSTFQRESTDDYRAASAVTLTCLTNVGVDEGLLYEWSSTCTGSCFVRGGTTKSVSTRYLHSYDSGVHTCVVYDGVGCSGNASISMNVVGAGIYVHAGHQVLPNNSIIVAGAGNRIGEFRCVSGSKRASVGHLINTAGEDTTTSSQDSFLVTRGSSHDPGMLYVRPLTALPPDDEGVYTCRTHDEREKVVSVHVGLYRQDSSLLVPPIIESLKSDFNLRIRKVYCTSSGSPPTNVLWTFNGQIIDTSTEGGYILMQKLIDRKSSKFFNVLTVLHPFDEAVGKYSCTVANSMGSDTAETIVKAMEITGYEQPFIVGLAGGINCTTTLNVSKMEWFLIGVDEFVEEQNTGSNTFYLPLNPKTTGLDGAMFMCKVTTVSGHEYNETITIHVKELDHSVSIEGEYPDNYPLYAGDDYGFTCGVVTDITPTVKWMGPDGNPVVDGDGIVLGDAIVEGDTTTLTIFFYPLRTSHGGSYSCLSVVDVPSSIRRAIRNIIVKIPPSLMEVVHTPNDTPLFTTSQLQLTCLVEVDPDVDTEVTVSNTWSGPSGEISSDSRITVDNNMTISLEDSSYKSTVHFSYLKSSDTGIYTCSSVVQPSVPSLYIWPSNTTSSAIRVNAALKVTIEISYTPPDQYPDYEPPNYRAVSSVTLRCVAEGAAGSVSYRWSSTCSSCFASSSSSSSISESFLRSRDTGVHTCTATDRSGNTGSNSTEMNIVGAGIYVRNSSDRGVAQNAQPNNTFVRAYSDRFPDRFDLFCCSNSRRHITGSINSNTFNRLTSSHWYYQVEQQRSNSYVGCIRFRLHNSNTSSLSLTSSSNRQYSGLFTCNVPDERGVEQHVNFGVYDESFGSRPVVYEFSHVSSQESSLTLRCNTRNAPPTSIIWQKDGETLDIDWNTIQMRQNITDYYYSHSYYENLLFIDSQPDDVIGRYTCTVSNKYGSYTCNNLTINGLQLIYEPEILVVSNSATLWCFSDLDVLQIQWFRDGLLVQSSTKDYVSELTLDLISTDHNGVNYTCRVTSPYGDQERSVILEVEVPDDWGIIEISTSTDEDAVHQTVDYGLVCTVNDVIDGMELTPDFVWYYMYPNGSVVVSGDENILISDPQKEGNMTTSTLWFSPVLSEHGGIYTCEAAVYVPWMREQPESYYTAIDMVVTTQAIFQLKIGPVQYCTEWNNEKAFEFEEWVKWNIERAVRQRCDCDFLSSAIYSGEFSCRKSKSSVVYRAIINGSSDLHTADELMDFIEDWRTNEGTLLYNKFRLDIAKKQHCSLSIESFNDADCSIQQNSSESPTDDTTNAATNKLQSSLSPDTCYSFQECDERN